MQSKLTVDDLYTLEVYARQRNEFRARVMEHKEHRKLHIGNHVTLLFEDRLTMLYQIQEMLRVERIFEEAGILAELEAYNPLIPDGANWKATMMIEFPDADERHRALKELIGIEDRVWVRIDGQVPVTGIADEDMERTSSEKTASVHFLRFELDDTMVRAVKNGGALCVGVSHPRYDYSAEAHEALRESLIADLD
jgi:hypothetical protein